MFSATSDMTVYTYTIHHPVGVLRFLMDVVRITGHASSYQKLYCWVCSPQTVIVTYWRTVNLMHLLPCCFSWMHECWKFINTCISEGLMHVASWYRGTPGPKFTKFAKFEEQVSVGQTPIMLLNFVTRRQEVCEIYVVQNLSSRKWLRRLATPFGSATHQCPSLYQISPRSVKQCTTNALYYFLHLSVFWRLRGKSLVQSSPVSALTYRTASRNYQLPNFVRFCVLTTFL